MLSTCVQIIMCSKFSDRAGKPKSASESYVSSPPTQPSTPQHTYSLTSYQTGVKPDTNKDGKENEGGVGEN